MNDKTYPTRFRNLSQDPQTLVDGPRVLALLHPGDVLEIESRNPLSTYARWEEVRFEKDGSISLVPRPGFEKPERGPWVLEVLNRDGQDLEERPIGGMRRLLPRGIPLLIDLTAADPLARFRKITIQKVQVRERSRDFEGYLEKKWKLKDLSEERSPDELSRLDAAIGQEG